ncbi:spermidine/putrescine transport system permease protein [Candidatus Kryptonium thompsonii]|jgi:spermidine/putrescine transport system permease protein|uniref:ABC transporter permease n=1 Tax=Candidatus Kryptonium thompsonii TaxID=1633631 RepID=UPI00070857D3|nr:ABC transporter permease [Candidatus Kryptonium thompsoni]CUS83958.1 spermidine/putrescine transport system permease protein [Candidatus Kryptonium thompsoni]CUS92095.1 spermidine/putrescine transport system permease protein [Candidatus Kryptonium thompsoni]
MRRSSRDLLFKIYIAGVYVFLYLPILVLIILSFNKSRWTTIWEGFTFQWYAKLLNNKILLNSLKNSIIVALVSTFFSTFFGTIGAIALRKLEFKLKEAFEILIYLPVIIPEIVLAGALLSFFGFIKITLGFTTVIIAHIVFSISYVILIVLARLQNIEKEVEESALDLGANEFEVFRRVTFPLLLPAIISSALIVFTLSIDDYLITSFVAGVSSTTLPLQIYSMLRTNITPEINAISTIMLLTTTVAIILSQKLLTSK